MDKKWEKGKETSIIKKKTLTWSKEANTLLVMKIF